MPEPEPRLHPALEAEVRRILHKAGRRILTEQRAGNNERPPSEPEGRSTANVA